MSIRSGSKFSTKLTAVHEQTPNVEHPSTLPLELQKRLNIQLPLSGSLSLCSILLQLSTLLVVAAIVITIVVSFIR